MRDDEIEEAATQSIGLGEAEQRAQRDAVRDEHVDDRQAEDHAEPECEHDDLDVVGHDETGRLHALVLRDVRPELVVVDLVDQLRRGDRVSGVGVGRDDEVADDRGDESHGE